MLILVDINHVAFDVLGGKKQLFVMKLLKLNYEFRSVISSSNIN